MINCADLRCKFRNNKGKCTCKKVELSSWNVNTVNMGRMDFLECKSFEYDEEYVNLGKKLYDLGIIPELPFDVKDSD